MTQVLDKAWADLSPNDIVRWRTPRFVKYGRVISRKGRSLLIRFAGDDRDTAIPDGKWYHLQFKMYGESADEYLITVDSYPEGSLNESLIDPAAHDDMITVREAHEILGIDPKQLRRHIRRGKLPAERNAEGYWVMNRDRLLISARKYGWL